MSGPRFLIVNADDFGLSEGINQGVIAAHERGILTSASLMVRWPAAAQAAAYARASRTLDVGLHLDLGEMVYDAGEWRSVYEVLPEEADEPMIRAEVARQIQGNQWSLRSVPVPGGGVRVVQQPLHPDLAFAVAWPARGFPTPAARAVLPAQVPFADAVENPRRLALLLEGLRIGDPELLALGGEDRLHVPYRLPRIEGAAATIEAARASGAWLATISGSGSGLVAIGPHARIGEIASEMRRALLACDAGAESRVVTPA